jgi:hypothetical protein
MITKIFSFLQYGWEGLEVHDSLIMQNFRNELIKIVKQNNLKKVAKICINISEDLEVRKQDIEEHIIELNKDILSENPLIHIGIGDLPECTIDLIIIEGERDSKV